MASFQSKLMKIILRSTLRPMLKRTSIDQMQRMSEVQARRPADGRIRRLRGGVQARALAAAGVPSEWLVPPGHPSAAEILPAEGNHQDTRPQLQQGNFMLYIHGGGWVTGSINSHRQLMARLALACGTAVLGIDYRLAPAYPYPAALDDCLAAYHWLLDGGVSPSRLVIAGDSAGGNLTLTTLLALREAGSPLPAAGICLSPVTDLFSNRISAPEIARLDPMLDPGAGHGWIQAYLAGQDPAQPLVSPLLADLHGLPPLLIQVGTSEMLHQDAVRFTEKAQQDGVQVTLQVWEGMFHVWQIFAPMLPESQQAIDKIGEFVRSRFPIEPKKM